MGYRGVRAYAYAFIFVICFIFVLIGITGSEWANSEQVGECITYSNCTSGTFGLSKFRWQDQLYHYSQYFNDESNTFNTRLSASDADVQGSLVTFNLVLFIIFAPILFIALIAVERMSNTWCNKIILPGILCSCCSIMNAIIAFGLVYVAIRHFAIDHTTELQIPEEIIISYGYPYTLVSINLVLIIGICVSELCFEKEQLRSYFHEVANDISNTSIISFAKNSNVSQNQSNNPDHQSSFITNAHNIAQKSIRGYDTIPNLPESTQQYNQL